MRGPVARALGWTLLSGLLFVQLNTLLRVLAQEIDPLQAQFLRYLFGLLVMLPFILRRGLAAYRPNDLRGQFWRGGVHSAALAIWFVALPHVPIAEMTAIGFTTPLFIMFGAILFLGERMRPERWAAACAGFAGVLVVLAPGLLGQGGVQAGVQAGAQAGAQGGSGVYALVMLAGTPLFAASFLITKALTRRDSAQVIVAWQSLTVALFSLVPALLVWRWPTMISWAGFLLAGVLGTLGHFAMTRGLALAEVSATQPVRFLELLWAALLGWLIFSERPGLSTFVGGAIIFAATTWIARREAGRR